MKKSYYTPEATQRSNRKKALQLGMSIGKANAILRKEIMFMLIKKANTDTCYQCGLKIDTVEEFSIEHKEKWMNTDEPVKLFFDINNISFSHRSCNIKVARTMAPDAVRAKHPSNTTYLKGCRCPDCKESHRIYNLKYPKKKAIKKV